MDNDSSRDAREIALGLLVDPYLGAAARVALAMSMLDAAMLRPQDASLALDIARGLLALLRMPEAAGLHDNLIQPYLPNLLGLSGALPPRTANDVFADREPERQGTATALESYRGPAPTAPLLAWIRAR